MTEYSQNAAASSLGMDSTRTLLAREGRGIEWRDVGGWRKVDEWRLMGCVFSDAMPVPPPPHMFPDTIRPTLHGVFFGPSPMDAIAYSWTVRSCVGTQIDAVT